MKSMFDMWHGGPINSREEMAQKIRNMKVTSTVMSETEAAIAARAARPLTEQIEAFEKFNKERKWTVERSEKSAPYVGERY